jgi:4-oxalmesaconate hydratase
MIIDVHGHYTTAPAALGAWRDLQIASRKDPSNAPKPSELKISDDELRESIETNQLAKMRERGSDLTVFSPRASFMAHHIGDFQTSATWAAICNELCFRVSQLYPRYFIGAAMLPQSPGVDTATCIPELERCVKDYGFVGIINPDPSGGHWTSPPLTDRYRYSTKRWWSLEIPAMIHVSRVNPCSTHGRALPQCRHDGVHAGSRGSVQGLPDLKFLTARRRGATTGRPRAGPELCQKPLLDEHLLNNISSTPAVSPARHRPLDEGDPGEERSVCLK